MFKINVFSDTDGRWWRGSVLNRDDCRKDEDAAWFLR